jgi:hypothetical protein
LRRRFKRSQASHFIEDAFRVQLAFQPLERAIHWFAFSNNDFWHQFTSIPENSPLSGLATVIYSGGPHPVKSGGKSLQKWENQRRKRSRARRISPDFELESGLALSRRNPVSRSEN